MVEESSTNAYVFINKNKRIKKRKWINEKFKRLTGASSWKDKWIIFKEEEYTVEGCCTTTPQQLYSNALYTFSSRKKYIN